MKGFALCYQRVIASSDDLVDKPDRTAADLGYAGSDVEQVVVVGRGFVSDVGFGDDHQGVVVLFHFFVGKSACAAEVAAAGLEPDEVVRMMDYAHLVGLGISDPNLGFMPAVHKKLAGRQGFEP